MNEPDLKVDEIMNALERNARELAEYERDLLAARDRPGDGMTTQDVRDAIQRKERGS